MLREDWELMQNKKQKPEMVCTHKEKKFGNGFYAHDWQGVLGLLHLRPRPPPGSGVCVEEACVNWNSRGLSEVAYLCNRSRVKDSCAGANWVQLTLIYIISVLSFFALMTKPVKEENPFFLVSLFIFHNIETF